MTEVCPSWPKTSAGSIFLLTPMGIMMVMDTPISKSGYTKWLLRWKGNLMIRVRHLMILIQD